MEVKEWAMTFFMIGLVWSGTWYLGASKTESIIAVMVYVLGIFIIYNQNIMIEEIRKRK